MSVDYIVTADHYAKREGANSVFERIQKLAKKVAMRGGPILHIPSRDPRGQTVFAEINFGQWIATCECGGAEMVSPGDPVFFCFSCGNRENNRYLRPVIFPDGREEIERLVLERPVNDARGLDDLERAYMARPVVYAEVPQEDGSIAVLPLSRSWTHDETVDQLREQNKAIHAWRKS